MKLYTSRPDLRHESQVKTVSAITTGDRIVIGGYDGGSNIAIAGLLHVFETFGCITAGLRGHQMSSYPKPQAWQQRKTPRAVPGFFGEVLEITPDNDINFRVLGIHRHHIGDAMTPGEITADIFVEPTDEPNDFWYSPVDFGISSIDLAYARRYELPRDSIGMWTGDVALKTELLPNFSPANATTSSD